MGAILKFLGYVTSQVSASKENFIYITSYKLRRFQYARATPKKETPCESFSAVLQAELDWRMEASSTIISSTQLE